MSHTTIAFNIGNSSDKHLRIGVSNFPSGKYSSDPDKDLPDYVTLSFYESGYLGVSLTLGQAQELRIKLDAALDRFEDERPGTTALCNCGHYPVSQCDCQQAIETEVAVPQ